MNRLSRTTALTLSALLASLLLLGCDDDSSEDREDAADARTQACRTFFLGGGADGASLVADLRAISTDGGFDPDALLVATKAVRQGAAAAGVVEDLSAEDYGLFRAVVAAVADVEGGIRGASDSRTLDTAVGDVLRGRLEAVESTCA